MSSTLKQTVFVKQTSYYAGKYNIPNFILEDAVDLIATPDPFSDVSIADPPCRAFLKKSLVLAIINV